MIMYNMNNPATLAEKTEKLSVLTSARSVVSVDLSERQTRLRAAETAELQHAQSNYLSAGNIMHS